MDKDIGSYDFILGPATTVILNLLQDLHDRRRYWAEETGETYLSQHDGR